VKACGSPSFRLNIRRLMKVTPPAPRLLALAALLPALAGAGLLSGCSIKKLAIHQLGDALAASGDTFASDDDPELVKGALPFSLKLIESLLAESPRHPGLLLAACRGFTLYGFGFVQQDADELEDVDLARADALRARARRLYLRARGYGLRGLERRHPGFEAALRRSPKEAATLATTRDVPLLFWTAAAWGAAISVSKDNPEMVSDQLIFEALIDRALALDESFDQGAIHSLLIGYEMSRQGRTDDPAARARRHFERAMEQSGARLASPLVALAESVAVPLQDRAEFESLLQRALAVDADAAPASRQMNLLAQRRARWLLGRADELFFTPAKEEAP
jgi:predicted anti-sigma-YlaC factor YlaD